MRKLPFKHFVRRMVPQMMDMVRGRLMRGMPEPVADWFEQDHAEDSLDFKRKVEIFRQCIIEREAMAIYPYMLDEKGYMSDVNEKIYHTHGNDRVEVSKGVYFDGINPAFGRALKICQENQDIWFVPGSACFWDWKISASSRKRYEEASNTEDEEANSESENEWPPCF